MGRNPGSQQLYGSGMPASLAATSMPATPVVASKYWNNGINDVNSGARIASPYRSSPVPGSVYPMVSKGGSPRTSLTPTTAATMYVASPVSSMASLPGASRTILPQGSAPVSTAGSMAGSIGSMAGFGIPAGSIQKITSPQPSDKGSLSFPQYEETSTISPAQLDYLRSYNVERSASPFRTGTLQDPDAAILSDNQYLLQQSSPGGYPKVNVDAAAEQKTVEVPDKDRDTTDEAPEIASMWPAGVGVGLVMLAPLLIL